MDDYNSRGWNMLHDACYRGQCGIVIHLLDSAIESQKEFIEMKTIDDYRATPLMLAAIGRQYRVIEILLQYGADMNAEIDLKINLRCGIVEMAVIQNDISLLAFLIDKIPSIGKRMKSFMIFDKLDKETRNSVGRTIRKITEKYSLILAKISKAPNESPEILLTKKELLTYETMNNENLGYYLAGYLKRIVDNEESIVNCVIILLNVINEERVRKNFCESNAIHFLITHMENEKEKIEIKINENSNPDKIKTNKPFKKLKWSDLDKESQNDDEINNDILIEHEIEIEREAYTEFSAVGQALSALARFNDSLELLNSDNYSYQIIDFVNILFEWNLLNKKNDKFDMKKNPEIEHASETPIYLEQYIGPLIDCTSNLVGKREKVKAYFNHIKIVEKILGLWNQLLIYFKVNKNLEVNFHSKSIHHFEESELPNKIEKNSGESENETETEENLRCVKNLIQPLSFELMKKLKLTVIESMGKLFCDNLELKRQYIYSYESRASSSLDDGDDLEKDWAKSTHRFIITLLSYLDAIHVWDHSLQLMVLDFLKKLIRNDVIIQKMLTSPKSLFHSVLISKFKSILRKSSPLNVRCSAMITLWLISGDHNYEESHDRKCILYKDIGAQEFVDGLYEFEDEVILICLEALLSICNGPPQRDPQSNQLVHGADDLGKVHAVPAILRLLKSSNEKIIFQSLKLLQDLCVTTGNVANFKNQQQICKVGGVVSLLDLINQRKNVENKLKCEVYYTLSLICLNNSSTRKTVFKTLNMDLISLITEIVSFIVPRSEQSDVSYSDENLEIEDISLRLKAGLIICAFCYLNQNFFNQFIFYIGQIDWAIYRSLLLKLNALLRKEAQKLFKEKVFQIQWCRCILGFQIVTLFNLIGRAEEDTRAIGMKLMIDIVQHTRNSYLRSIACDYVGRLICFDNSLIEPFITINIIETLGGSITEGQDSELDNFEKGETEKSNAAISLGFFTMVNSEARRRLLKISRKDHQIMQVLKRANKTLHSDLVNDWNHFKELNQSASIHKLSFSQIPKLPDINKNKNKTKLNRIFI